MNNLVHFDLTVTQLGTGSVVKLNGEKLAGVRRVQLEFEYNKPTQLTITYQCPEVTASGIAEVNEDRPSTDLRVANVDPLLQALRSILNSSKGECERTTNGIGDCFKNGYSPDAPDYADRCCNACIAHRALTP